MFTGLASPSEFLSKQFQHKFCKPKLRFLIGSKKEQTIPMQYRYLANKVSDDPEQDRSKIEYGETPYGRIQAPR
jgi:hypothetical protein